VVRNISDNVADLQQDHIPVGVQMDREKGLARLENFPVRQTEEAGTMEVGKVAFYTDSGMAAGILCFQADKQVQGKPGELPEVGPSFALYFDLEPVLTGRKTELVMVLDKAHNFVQVALEKETDFEKEGNSAVVAL
jgi:hypothetical protein